MLRAVPLARDATLDDAGDPSVLAPSFVTSFPLENGAFHESFERLLEHRDATLLVVEEDRGRVTGDLLTFVHDSLFAHGSVDWIGEAAVKASVRRQGYG
jgi:hypothetical protein